MFIHIVHAHRAMYAGINDLWASKHNDRSYNLEMIQNRRLRELGIGKWPFNQGASSEQESRKEFFKVFSCCHYVYFSLLIH